MGAVGLPERLKQTLALQGSTTPADTAEHAAAVASLLLAHGAPGGEDLADLEAAIRLVAALCELPDAEADAAVALAAEPDHRPIAGEQDIHAFEARFGLAAGRRLIELTASGTDLEGYSRARGPHAATRLLDAMYALAARDGVITADEQRRLEAAGEALAVDPALNCLIHRRHAPDAAARQHVVRLKGERITIGRAPGSGLLLPDPQVALHHADLVAGPEGWRVVDANSGRATVVGGRPVRSAPVGPLDVIRIGTYELRVDPKAGEVTTTTTRELHALRVDALTRKVGDTVLLNDVGFTVLSGEVVAVVGPSGAGKTTLLNAISGLAPADSGDVSWDGQPFASLLARDRSRVGSVPQDDIVHPELTVEESLRYGAQLRLPPGVERDAAVRRVLSELGIESIADSRIGDAVRRGISGGQRKRVNLGQELLSRTTSVLFLDEPTSGLDPRAAQDIVRLVRQLADRGRMVFLVSHDLSPLVMAQVDHLLVLVPGGRLAWFGPPRAACRYFGVDTPDAIFDCLAGRPPEAWQRAFEASPAHRRYVASREALGVVAPTAAEPPPPAPPPSVARQWAVLVRRYARVKSRDRTGMWVLGVQPPFLALVMAVVFPAPTGPMLFLLTLSCLWFGMSAAVRELIADRTVWERERRVGVSVVAHVGSKVAVLGVISVLQCTFLSMATWWMFDLWTYGFPALGLAATCSLVGLCGVSLGLLVSALLSSTEAAVGTLLLLLIPQITLSGLLVDLRDLSPVSRGLTWLDPLRYAFEAMLKVGDKVAAPERVPGKWRAQSYTGSLYDYGFKSADVEDLGLSVAVLVAALVGFSALFLVGALVAMARRR